MARLREQSDHDRATLNACLAQIDQLILTCVDQIDEYQKNHALLISLNERLTTLGAKPEPLAESLRTQNLSDTIQWRFEGLRHQGKL